MGAPIVEQSLFETPAALARARKERLTGDDNFMSGVIKLAEGNPGAITALMEMSKHAPRIDPDSAWGQLGPMLSCDTHGIYGSHIWLFWKDICGMDPVKSETLFRATQLGILGHNEIRAAIAAADDGSRWSATSTLKDFDFPGLLAKIRETLPGFAPGA
jgi:hypothetical protein